MRGHTLIAAMLLLAAGTVCRAGESGGLLSRCGSQACCQTDCCTTSCQPSCCESGGCNTYGCHGARGIFNRSKCDDCCDNSCRDCVTKIMQWLCFRAPRCRHCDCKGHTPCCTPPLYTFFTCCEGYGCSSCTSCNSCTSCCGK